MPRTLSLQRPLISFDLETTGLSILNDRIVEISCVKMLPDGQRQVKTARFNPGRPISPEATSVHGIHDEDVAHCATFADSAALWARFMADADLTGFNIERFDLPMLTQEFARAGIKYPEGPVAIIDAWRIFCHFEPRDLSAAYRFYCGKTLDNAHSAEADAMASADILMAQVCRYESLPNDPTALHAFCHPVRPDWVDQEGKIVWQGQEAALGFGQHRGKTLADLARDERDYLRWVIKGQFSEAVRKICSEALAGRFLSREQPSGSSAHDTSAKTQRQGVGPSQPEDAQAMGPSGEKSGFAGEGRPVDVAKSATRPGGQGSLF